MILLHIIKVMTSRDLTKELQYFTYTDMEGGNDTETIHYPALISILQDLVERVEQLEKDDKLLSEWIGVIGENQTLMRQIFMRGSSNEN